MKKTNIGMATYTASKYKNPYGVSNLKNPLAPTGAKNIIVRICILTCICVLTSICYLAFNGGFGNKNMTNKNVTKSVKYASKKDITKSSHN
jgi:hypothetical protein